MGLVSFRRGKWRNYRGFCWRSRIVPEQKDCGSRYLESIANVLYAIADFWEAYERVIPSSRHRVVGKDSGKTNLIERFNCTLRQRISRLVRKTLSFSKKLDNHIGAIWYARTSLQSILTFVGLPNVCVRFTKIPISGTINKLFSSNEPSARGLCKSKIAGLLWLLQ